MIITRFFELLTVAGRLPVKKDENSQLLTAPEVVLATKQKNKISDRIFEISEVTVDLPLFRISSLKTLKLIKPQTILISRDENR